MKKKYSLKRNEEIAKIVRSRRFYKNDSFALYYAKNLEIGHSRVCISVSKKNGNAVVRNKIKRQVREIVTDILSFDLQYDFVIVVRINYLNNDFSTNYEKLNELIMKFNSNIKE